jgi:hypothetical protein
MIRDPEAYPVLGAAIVFAGFVVLGWLCAAAIG